MRFRARLRASDTEAHRCLASTNRNDVGDHDAKGFGDCRAGSRVDDDDEDPLRARTGPSRGPPSLTTIFFACLEAARGIFLFAASISHRRAYQRSGYEQMVADNETEPVSRASQHAEWKARGHRALQQAVRSCQSSFIAQTGA